MDLQYLFLQSGTPEILRTPITFGIIILTVLISYQAFTKPEMAYKLIFNANVIKEKGEWYRFWSHGLIHANWLHLGLNMFVLYEFGRIVEQLYVLKFGVIGSILYLAMYGLGLAAASIYSYIKHQNNYGYNALGASGAVAGVVFAFILFAPTEWLLLFFIIPVPALILGIAYLVYSQVMGKRGRDNIGHDAHFWGAVWGFVFTILLDFIILKGEVSYRFIMTVTSPAAWIESFQRLSM